MLVRLVGQEAAGQHGNQGQRHKSRDQNGQAHDHGKLVEQQADHAGHEKNRDKNCHQRNRNRNDGEAHLARAAQGCAERLFAFLHMADDVFQHHDGIVHHQPHGQGQAQEGNIVQAVIQPPEQSHRAH